MEQIIKKSGTGSTKWVDSIYFEIDNAKSHAASILLREYYWQRDEDNIKSIANKMRMIGFSRTYLTKVLAEKGHLACSYCPKKNLIIELDGMRVPNGIKATIDHIVAISKGGGLFDYENICVACGSCNGAKSNMSLEEFEQRRAEESVLKGLNKKERKAWRKENKNLSLQHG